jgi:NAD(P)-dependent dehydrogenase (short-subunit alcohol dehydrogenase family)
MRQISFEGRVAVVTGAGGGLGRTYALDIARRGGTVVVNDLGCDVDGRNPSPAMANAVVREIRDAGGRALANHDDVGDRAGAQRLVEAAISEFGRLDVVINNAGTLRTGWFGEAKDEDLEAQIGTHLFGALNVTKAAWPHMKAQRYGRVVFTSSATGLFGTPGQAGYAAAKGGVVGLMNVLALEGLEDGILCNTVLPHAIGRMSGPAVQAQGQHGLGRSDEVKARAGDSYTPAYNTALAVYLASETCETTHRVYSSIAGNFARVFIGVTSGWQGSREHPASAEDVAAHFDQIGDLAAGFTVPTNTVERVQIALGLTPE